jgi:hypothetical protein
LERKPTELRELLEKAAVSEPKMVKQQTRDSPDNWRDSQDILGDSTDDLGYSTDNQGGVHKMLVGSDDEDPNLVGDIDGVVDAVPSVFAPGAASYLEQSGGKRTRTVVPRFGESPVTREETMLQRDNQLEPPEATNLREDTNSEGSKPCLEASQEWVSPHSTSEESHAETQEPDMKTYHRLSIHYPTFAMSRLKDSCQAMVSILERWSVLDSVDVLAGYDILPTEASFLGSDAKDFFTGLCYSDCYG